MIKQEIPVGYVRSPLNEGLCKDSHIDCKVIVTAWVWRAGHANAVKTVIIKDCDLAKAKLIANYYKH
jgi:hypothetical protein